MTARRRRRRLWNVVFVLIVVVVIIGQTTRYQMEWIQKANISSSTTARNNSSSSSSYNNDVDRELGSGSDINVHLVSNWTTVGDDDNTVVVTSNSTSSAARPSSNVSQEQEQMEELKTSSNVEVTNATNTTQTKLPTETEKMVNSATIAAAPRCPPSFTYMEDKDAPSQGSSVKSKIPNVLYQTGPSRCIPTDMYQETVAKWLSLDYLSYRFHDDDDMDRLLYDPKWKTEFPTLHLALQCIEHANIPVMKADIWRYLVLWEYGGIFADLDVAPSIPKFQQQNGSFPTAANEEEDAVFVNVQTGPSSVVSQWFIAVAPHHPIMHYAIQIASNNVLWWRKAKPLIHTGPKALYGATGVFLMGTNVSDRELEVRHRYYDVQHNRSFFVLPHTYAHNLASPSKDHSYDTMNVTHYTHSMKGYKYDRKRCFEFLGGNSIRGGNTTTEGSSSDRIFELNGTVYDLKNITMVT